MLQQDPVQGDVHSRRELDPAFATGREAIERTLLFRQAEPERSELLASKGSVFVAPLLEIGIGNERSAEPLRNDRCSFHGPPLGARNQHALSKRSRHAQSGLQCPRLRQAQSGKTEVEPWPLAADAIMKMMSVPDQVEGGQASAPEASQPGMSGSTRVASWASDSCQPR